MHARWSLTLSVTFLLSACNTTTAPPAVPLAERTLVSTLAGSGTYGDQGGKGAQAQFHNPVNLTVDPQGNVYVADFDDDLPGSIRKITPQGEVSTLFTRADFHRPFGIAYSQGNLYVTTDRNSQGGSSSALWKLNATTGAATLLSDSINGGRERGMVALPDGRLVLTDRAQHRVLLVNPSTDPLQVSSLAGTGEAGFKNGMGTAAQFNSPYGLALLGDKILVADAGNACIRTVTLAGVVDTYAGQCSKDGFKDGPAGKALLKWPQALAADSQGNVYVSDTGSHKVRVVRPDRSIETVAGDGTTGFRDGIGTDAQFFAQEGLTMQPDSKTLLLTDGSGGENSLPFRRIRQVQLP